MSDDMDLQTAVYDLVREARAVVDSRSGDTDRNADGISYATCDCDSMIRLEMAVEAIDELVGRAGRKAFQANPQGKL
jgi:hypothetical protein